MPSDTCIRCNSTEIVAGINQKRFCEEHALKYLDELEKEKDHLEEEYNEAKQKYNQLREKFDVDSYGELEHQFNVEGREDITEEDVRNINNAESEFAAARNRFEGVKKKYETLVEQLH